MEGFGIVQQVCKLPYPVITSRPGGIKDENVYSKYYDIVVLLYYIQRKIFSESVVLCHNAPDWSER